MKYIIIIIILLVILYNFHLLNVDDNFFLAVATKPTNSFPTAPNPTKPQTVYVAGKPFKGLLQYKNGQFIANSNGTQFTATIDPKSLDGSKKGDSTSRLRNELAVKNMIGGSGTISFNLKTSGSQNVSDSKSSKSTNIFQIKPSGQGGNDAFLRLGVKQGKITYGIDGGNQKPTDISASVNNKVDIKLNTNTGKHDLYINGKLITSFKASKGDLQDANVKFGAEGFKNETKGRFSSTYSNVSFT